MVNAPKHSCFFLALLLLLLGCEERQECDAFCELLRENWKADFERLTTQVEFRIEFKRGLLTDVDIYKTQAGIIARYKPWGRFLELMEIELSMEEWQDFIKSLYGYLRKDFDERSRNYEYRKGARNDIAFTRSFIISYPNEYEPGMLKAWKTDPSDSSDWDGVEKLMNGMVTKIRERAEKPFEDKLRAEYMERFGEPISDFELSMKMVKFWKRDSSCFIFEVFKTETGARAETCDIDAELSTGEWLDFVRALRKSGVGEMESKYGELSAKREWGLDIYSSGKLYPDIIEGFGAYPPNWDELEKTMEDMAKIIKKRGEKKW
jgi:hypothetical protein